MFEPFAKVAAVVTFSDLPHSMKLKSGMCYLNIGEKRHLIPRSLPVTQPFVALSPGTTFTSTYRAMTAATTLEDHSTSCKPQDPMPPNLKTPSMNGDLNNTASMRVVLKPQRHPDFAFRSLAIPASIDHSTLRSRYRPFLLPDKIQCDDWVSRLELATVTEMAYNDFKITGERIKVLILYGSLRQR